MNNRQRLNRKVALTALLMGIILLAVPLIEFDSNSPSHIMAIFLGITLFFIAMIGVRMNIIYNQKLEHLQTDDILGKWTYIPENTPIVYHSIVIEKLNHVTTNILIYIVCIIISVGYLYSTASNAVWCTFLTWFLCTLLFINLHHSINKYYRNMLNQPMEVIFSRHYIYFKDSFFTSNYSIYTLRDITINQETSNSIDLIYTTVGDMSSEYILSLPIPCDSQYDPYDLCEYYHKSLTPVYFYD